MNKIRFESVYAWFLAVFAGVIILLPKPVALCFAGFGIIVLAGTLTKKLRLKADLPGLLLISFYLIYIIYIAFTRNPGWAATYAENKLSFVLLPLLFFFRPVNAVSWNIPLTGFVVSSIVLFFTGFIGGWSCYADTGAINCYFASLFSKLHHPTYASAFYLFSLAIIVYGYRKKWRFYRLWTAVPAGMIALGGIVLCLSFAGILYMLIFFGCLFLFLIYRKFGKIAAAVSLIILPVACYVVIQKVPRFEAEYTSSKFYFDKYRSDPSDFVKTHVYPDISGSEVRLIMWTASSQCFAQYPLGVGTGNVDGVLAYKLNKLGQHRLATEIENFNPHNQYLQTGLETGIFGLLILLSILISGAVVAIKYKNYLLLVVLGSLAFNMLFESMLQRQSGIVFFTFAICLLVSMQKKMPDK